MVVPPCSFECYHTENIWHTAQKTHSPSILATTSSQETTFSRAYRGFSIIIPVTHEFLPCQITNVLLLTISQSNHKGIGSTKTARQNSLTIFK